MKTPQEMASEIVIDILTRSHFMGLGVGEWTHEALSRRQLTDPLTDGKCMTEKGE